jgi:hypothetical protein
MMLRHMQLYSARMAMGYITHAVHYINCDITKLLLTIREIFAASVLVYRACLIQDVRYHEHNANK